MRIVCYFAAAEGSHPHCSISDYDKMWPVMQASVERQGYELVHLTGMEDRARCRETFRVDVDPATVMFSREVAWLRFLNSLQDSETAVLIEPDCYLLRQIPDLHPSSDFMLLTRPGRVIPSGFRMARRTAMPFYEAVVDAYAKMPHEKKVFHGDVDAQHELLSVSRSHGIPPSTWRGLVIERRNWIHYTSKLWRDAVAWNFKGTSKHYMLAMADGVMPEMR